MGMVKILESGVYAMITSHGQGDMTLLIILYNSV